jgi:hypothetical protein
MPRFAPEQLRRTTIREYGARFVFGGAVGVAAYAVGVTCGPTIGGLFLAFPALLPASLTLVKEHDGRGAAADDARGALLGALGLASFGAVIAFSARWETPWLSLGLALATWVLVSAGLWWCLLEQRSGVSQHTAHSSSKSER